MAYSKTTPSGETFQVPEKGDPNWGASVTAILDRSLDSLQAGDLIQTAELAITPLEITVEDATIVNATSSSLILMSTDGTDVTLNEVTPIATPTARNGKILHLVNVDPLHTITIPDSGNVNSNGGATLFNGSIITFVWVGSLNRWLEISRNN